MKRAPAGTEPSQEDDLPDPRELAATPRKERNCFLVDALAEGHFDFLDFGSHRGASLKIGYELGGRRGLGIERNDDKCRELLAQGQYVLSEDIFSLPALSGVVDFAVCSHILEHMPNEHTVYLILEKLARATKRFILIDQPDFSAELYLFQRGFKLAHFAMKGHDCHLPTRRLVEMLWSLDLGHFVVGGKHAIVDSSNPWVHRADAPGPLWKWDAEKDLPKEAVKFNRPLYRDVTIVVGRDPSCDLEHIAKSTGVKDIYLRSHSALM